MQLTHNVISEIMLIFDTSLITADFLSKFEEDSFVNFSENVDFFINMHSPHLWQTVDGRWATIANDMMNFILACPSFDDQDIIICMFVGYVLVRDMRDTALHEYADVLVVLLSCCALKIDDFMKSRAIIKYLMMFSADYKDMHGDCDSSCVCNISFHCTNLLSRYLHRLHRDNC